MFFKGRYVKGEKSGIWVIYIQDGTFNLLLSGKYRNGKVVSKKQHLPPPIHRTTHVYATYTPPVVHAWGTMTSHT
jgi:hypothetical protein